MTAYVLVHGAWHGGWCWVRVAERLIRAGHRVLTPTLTGLGERAHLLSPAVNLDTHIADIVGVLEAEELSDVVLCGHSYAGMVVTGVADRAAERIRALVYLDAYVPKDGQAARDLRLAEMNAATDRLVAEKGEGWWAPPRGAASFDVDRAEDRAWVDRRLTPHPYATMTQPIRLTGAWEAVPVKVFIKAVDYRTSPFGPFAAAAEADPAWTCIGIDSGHDVMVDRPDALAAELLKV